MPASVEAARAGVTTGEWADTMREVLVNSERRQELLFQNLWKVKTFLNYKIK